jgi:hypothetical protein
MLSAISPSVLGSGTGVRISLFASLRERINRSNPKQVGIDQIKHDPADGVGIGGIYVGIWRIRSPGGSHR